MQLERCLCLLGSYCKRRLKRAACKRDKEEEGRERVQELLTNNKCHKSVLFAGETAIVREKDAKSPPLSNVL